MSPTALTDFTAADWRALNSATQYPSIPTYHALGERGRLTEARNVDFAGELVEITEKIDGTNARIVIPHPMLGRPVIGSRTTTCECGCWDCGRGDHRACRFGCPY